MLFGLLVAFVPLFLGYLWRVSATVLKWSNRITLCCLYLILLIMGISLGQLEQLDEKLPQIATLALGLSVILQSCNMVCLMIFDKLLPMPQKEHQPVINSRWRMLRESLQLCMMIVIGGVIGFFIKGVIAFPLHASTYVLIIMIFFVGIQLRNSGIPLRQVFFNQRGLLTAFIFIVSSILAAVFSTYLLDLPLNKALALASGFGWYSLSSVLINDAWGAVYGSVAFFNDLSREIFCLFAIPFFIRHFPSTAVGLGGATSLDATLPIIQKSGGIEIVPLAISFGFIINLVVPLLMPFFIGLH